MSFDSLLKDSCTFQLNTPTADSSGQFIPSWADVGALTSLKCRIEPIGGGLMRTPTEVYEAATHTLFLRKPVTPTITTENYRVVINSQNYKLLLVQDLSGMKKVNHLEIILELIT